MTNEREKMKARRLVRDALKMGYLTRPDACNRCGVTPKIGSDGYNITVGKKYIVEKFEPPYQDPTSSTGFIWPAYVSVLNDSNKLICCHASRFVEFTE